MKLGKLTLLVFASFFINHSIFSQITTATIKGKIIDKKTTETLIGATILATHQNTGTEYGTTTDENGMFVIPNMTSGGPYQILVSYVGYENLEQKDIYLPLGTVQRFDFKMEIAAEDLKEIEVVFNKDDLFSGEKTGAETNVDADKISRLPSLNRSLQDMTRLSPQGNANTFAGTNYRFNNLSIDGASNNDVLGFQDPAAGAGGSVATGTPGGNAGTQPISLDAISEVQISIAPFDVRQGNFTGANLNAVTRSGSNILEGSVYAFGHNQNSTGTSINESRRKLEEFSDYQIGARLGFPILKNKLFGFVNYELARRTEPALNVPGREDSNIPLSVVESIENHLLTNYNYDPGTFGEKNIDRISDKLFVRLDYNIAKNHSLALRHNYVKAHQDVLDRGQSIARFSSNGFRHNSTTNSSVLELKSRFKNRIANQLIIGYNRVEDNRTFEGDIFPHTEVKYLSNNILLGTYREGSIYGATLGTTQITDQLNIYLNNHTLTFGTSNEFYNIEYRFLTAWNGRWEYKSVEKFLADSPSRIRGVYNYSDNSFEFNRNNPSADFRVFLLSAYLQDEMQVSDRLKVTAGLRLDAQVLPDEMPLTPEVPNTPEFSHIKNEVYQKPQLNPRLGFNLQLDEENTTQLRGGAGLFSGRMPFAWYGYIYYISGIDYGNIDLRPDGEFPIIRDLSELQNEQPGLTELNLIENDFKLPRMLRTSLALDKKFQNEWQLSLEALYSKTINGILFQNINLVNETAPLSGADKRKRYILSGEDKKVNPTFTNVFLIANTDQGYQYSFTINLSKDFRNGLKASVAYTFGESKDIANGVRNSPAANYNRNQAVFGNSPDLAFSNFDLRHRVITNLDYKLLWKNRSLTYATAFFSASSGRPFSYTIAGDLNGDNSSRNDLPYVPNSDDEINFIDIIDENGQVEISAEDQWQQFDEFIENDDHLSTRRGRYAQRNGGRTPWNYQMDVRLAHRIAFGEKQNLEITLDIFNFLNLLNRDWGWQHFVPNVTNSSFQLLDFEGLNENGEPTYQFVNDGVKPYQVDPLASRWRMQLGLRFSF